MWIIAAIFSAVFAGLTAILVKCGISNKNSDVATALRTIVVLVFSVLMVFIVGSQSTICEISRKSWIFLILYVFLKESLSKKAILGLVLMCVGTLAMVIWV